MVYVLHSEEHWEKIYSLLTSFVCAPGQWSHMVAEIFWKVVDIRLVWR